MKRYLALFGALALVAVQGGAVAKEWVSQRKSPQERGKLFYEQSCMSCHGEKGAGDGPATAALVAEVPNLSEIPKKKIEGYVGVVLRGKGAMPAYEQTYTREEATDIINHMAGLNRTPPANQRQPRAEPVKPEQVEEDIGEAQQPAPQQ